MKVKLETLCGCSKYVDLPSRSQSYHVAYRTEPLYGTSMLNEIDLLDDTNPQIAHRVFEYHRMIFENGENISVFKEKYEEPEIVCEHDDTLLIEDARNWLKQNK